jgi:hypothetical protein
MKYMPISPTSTQVLVMIESILLVFGALLLPSGIHHTVKRVLQHHSSFHSTSISISNLDTFWYYPGE